mgnify:CR=1 FL=1
MGAAMQQVFMTREEYKEVREEDRAWRYLRRPLCLLATFLLFVVIIVSSSVSLSIVFPRKSQAFCSKHPIPPSGILDDSMHSYYFTEYEATQYFWLVVFLPTTALFLVSAIYLFAGRDICQYLKVQVLFVWIWKSHVMFEIVLDLLWSLNFWQYVDEYLLAYDGKRKDIIHVWKWNLRKGCIWSWNRILVMHKKYAIGHGNMSRRDFYMIETEGICICIQLCKLKW